jgi:hypothetical protein
MVSRDKLDEVIDLFPFPGAEVPIPNLGNCATTIVRPLVHRFAVMKMPKALEELIARRPGPIPTVKPVPDRFDHYVPQPTPQRVVH